jgi:hypothetical protein
MLNIAESDPRKEFRPIPELQFLILFYYDFYISWWSNSGQEFWNRQEFRIILSRYDSRNSWPELDCVQME